MTPGDAFPDDELASEGSILGSLDELEELHEEPLDLDLGDDEEVGLDAEGFEPGDDDHADLVGSLASGATRFDDEPPALELEEDAGDADLPEYGWTAGLEPTDALEDDFEPVAEAGIADDGGEEGVLGEDVALEPLELPLPERGTEPSEDGPIEPLDAFAIDTPD